MEQKTQKKIEKLRDKTYQEAKKLLSKYGKAAIIRPTGFGKTGILTRFIRDYDKVLYLYPTEVIKQAVLRFYYQGQSQIPDSIPNVEFMTYTKLVRMKDEDFERVKDVSLIITDECHRLGAAETLYAMNELKKALPNALLLGATATPERMDMIDEIALFFDDHRTSEYTLHDAIKDGILPKPRYYFCAYGGSDEATLAGLEKEAKYEVAKKLPKDARKDAEFLLKSRIVEIANLMKMDNVIKQSVADANVNPEYLRFIVFCTGFTHLRSVKANVNNWFLRAYPDHRVNMIDVTSETSESRENVDLLKDMPVTKNQIDLIFACDMLNMGYHVNDLTGIIMYRGTQSGIVYCQQLGRVLSTGTDRAGVVIDVVDNLHRKSCYAMLSEYDDSYVEEAITPEEKERFMELIQRTHDKDENGNPIALTQSEQDEMIALRRKMKDNGAGYKRKANQLLPVDLIATSYEATYRELINKTVAEERSMRRRQAWGRWLEKGGDDSIMTRAAILGQNPPQAVPLAPFCKLKNVSVNEVLDEMGVTT